MEGIFFMLIVCNIW